MKAKLIFCLVVFGLLLVGGFLFYNYQNKKVDLGVFEIPKKDFDSLLEASKNFDEDSFKMCSIKENKCVVINKLK